MWPVLKLETTAVLLEKVAEFGENSTFPVADSSVFQVIVAASSVIEADCTLEITGAVVSGVDVEDAVEVTKVAEALVVVFPAVSAEVTR